MRLKLLVQFAVSQETRGQVDTAQGSRGGQGAVWWPLVASIRRSAVHHHADRVVLLRHEEDPHLLFCPAAPGNQTNSVEAQDEGSSYSSGQAQPSVPVCLRRWLVAVSIANRPFDKCS